MWRYVRAGRFAAPVRITTGSTRYVLEDVVAWMASQEGAALRRRHAHGAHASSREHPQRPTASR
jgi:hypothetical protein